MSYKVKTIEMNPLRIQQLKKKLLSQGKQSSWLIQMLDLPLQQIQEKLMHVSAIPEHYYTNYISQGSRVCFLQTFFNKLNDEWIIKNQKMFALNMMTLQKLMEVSENERKTFFLYLINRLNDLMTVYGLFQEKFIEKNQNDLDDKPFTEEIRNFMIKTFKIINNREENEDNYKKYFSHIDEKQKKLILLKIVKCYSWIFFQQLIPQCNEDIIYKDTINYENLQHFYELLQIKREKSYKLANEILAFKIQSANGNRSLVTESSVYKINLSHQLFQLIFSKTIPLNNICFFQHLDQENKIAIFRFDLIAFSENVFANLVFHSLLMSDTKQSFGKCADCFLSILLQLKLIFRYLDFEMSAYHIEEGRLQLKKYSRDDKQQLVNIALLMWMNIHKIIYFRSSKLGESKKQLYNKYYSFIQDSFDNVYQIFVKSISFCQHLSEKILSKIAFLVFIFAQMCQNKYKQIYTQQNFGHILVQKIIKALERLPDNKKQVIVLIKFILYNQKLIKNLGFSKEELPFNQKHIYTYLVDAFYINIDEHPCFQTHGPTIYGSGSYFQTIRNNNFLFKLINQKDITEDFKQYVRGKFLMLLNQMETRKDVRTTSINRRRIYQLIELFNLKELGFCQSQEIRDKIYQIVKHESVNISLYFSSSAKQYETVLRNLKINIQNIIRKQITEVTVILRQAAKKCNFAQLMRNIHIQDVFYIKLLKRTEYLIVLMMAYTQSSNQKIFIEQIFELVQSALEIQNLIKKQRAIFYVSSSYQQLLKLKGESKITVRCYSQRFTIQRDLQTLLRVIRQVICSMSIENIMKYVERFSYFLQKAMDYETSRFPIDYIYFCCTIFMQLKFYGYKIYYHVGPIFYQRNQEIIEKLVNVACFKVKPLKDEEEDDLFGDSTPNEQIDYFILYKKQKKQEIQSYQGVLRGQISDSVQKLISHIFSIYQSVSVVYINQKAYYGPKNLARIQKSLLHYIFLKINENLNIQVIKFYADIVKEICVQIDKIQTKTSKQLQKEQIYKTEEIIVQLMILNREICNDVLNQLKFRFVKQLYQMSVGNKQKNLQQVAKTVYKSIKQQEKIKQHHLFFGQILNNIQKLIDNGCVVTKQYQIQFEWLNPFLQALRNIKIQQYLSINFIEKIVKLIRYFCLQPIKKEQNLTFFLLVLQKLLPNGKIETTQSDHIIYFKTIIELIQHIISTFDYENSDFYLSVMTKAILTKNRELQKYIQYFIEKSSIETQFGDLVCNLMQHQIQDLNIEMEIKTFFLRNYVDSQQQRYIQVKLSDLIYQFKDKYQDKLPKFTRIIKQLASKSTKIIGDIKEVYVLYNLSQSLQLSQLDQFKNFRVIDFEPAPSFWYLISWKLKLLEEDIQKNRGILDQIIKIISNYPILLPYILSFKFKSESDKRQTFLNFIIEKTMESQTQVLLNFLLFLCLEHSSFLKTKNGYILLVDYICFEIVRNAIDCQLNLKVLLVILYLSQTKHFSKMCCLKIQNNEVSLKQKVQKYMYLNTNNTEKDNLSFLCTLFLSNVNRYQSTQALRKYISDNLQNKSYQFKLIDFSLIPFGGVISEIDSDITISPQSLLTTKDKNLMESFSQIQQKLLNLHKQLNEQKKQFKLVSEQNIIVSEDIVKLISRPNLKLRRFLRQQIVSGKISRGFTQLFKQVEAWCKDRTKKGILRDFISLSKKFDFDNEDNKMNAVAPSSNLEEMIQPSRFAPLDYNSRYITRNQELANFQSQDMHQVLHKSLQEIQFQRQTSKGDNISKHKGDIDQKKLLENQKISSLIKGINDLSKNLMKPLFDLEQLQNKSEQKCLEYLQLKYEQLNFDLKEETLSNDEFEEYCLSNINKLQRLDSKRRNRVKKIEQEVLQYYLRRNSSSDSIGYIIDSIDQNYQWFSPNSAEILPLQQPKPKLKQPKIKQLHLKQIPLEAFSQISDDTLMRFMYLFYIEKRGISYESFIPFLQNKRVQGRIINTLLSILRNIGDHLMFVWNQKRQKNEQQFRLIRSDIVNFICSFYEYAFYRDDNYLLDEIDTTGLFGVKLQPKEQFSHYCLDKTKHRPIYEVIAYMYDCNIQRQRQIRLFRGVKQLPFDLLNNLINFIQKLEFQQQDQQDADFQYYINLKKKLNVKENLKEISSNQLFRTEFKSRIKIETLYEKPIIAVMFIDLDLFGVQEMKALHKNILQLKKQSTSYLVFLNEVIKLYSDQQLKNADWFKQNLKIYSMLLEKLSKQTKNIKKEPIYRLIELNLNVKTLDLNAKYQFLLSEISCLVNDLSQQRENSHINAQRKQGIFESAFEDLRYKCNKFWLSYPQVSFIDQNGNKQSGYGSGVSKEWYTLVTRGMVNLNYGLFTKTSKNYYYFNRESWINPRHLQFLQFIGKLFAMSIINRDFYVCPSFSTLIYKMILGVKIEIEDLIFEFDEGQVILNVDKLRQITDNYLFCQTFVYHDIRLFSNKKLKIDSSQNQNSNIYLLKQTIQVQRTQKMQESNMAKTAKVFKVGEAIELIPGGSSINVTLQNVEEYIRLTKEKIYDIIINGVKKQADAFLEGFNKVIDIKYLQKFTPEELRTITQGIDTISVSDLKENVSLNGFSSQDQQIQWFWEAFEQLNGEDKSYFIQHWTGSPKLPVAGVKEMELKIAKNYNQIDKRIFAQTCFKKISLPLFQSKEKLVQSLKEAICTIKLGFSIQQDH